MRTLSSLSTTKAKFLLHLITCVLLITFCYPPPIQGSILLPVLQTPWFSSSQVCHLFTLSHTCIIYSSLLAHSDRSTLVEKNSVLSVGLLLQPLTFFLCFYLQLRFKIFFPCLLLCPHLPGSYGPFISFAVEQCGPGRILLSYRIYTRGFPGFIYPKVLPMKWRRGSNHLQLRVPVA